MPPPADNRFVTRLPWLCGALFLILFTTLGTGYYAFGSPFDPFDNARFSSAGWKGGSDELRARMSRDLIANVIRPGDQKLVIVALLGEPMKTISVIPGERMLGNSRCDYYIGNWSNYNGMDSAFVYIHFDPNDRVVGAEIFGY